MRSIGSIALLFVVVFSVVGAAQCGCGVPEPANCYLAFKTTETIAFKLIAPVDYFEMHGTTVSPRIFGWRAETWDGNVVRTVMFPGEPRSRLEIMEWDLYGEDGVIVAPGEYRIVVMSTDGEVSYPVRIVEVCRTCCGCFCGYAALACDVPCCIPFGELYLDLWVGETRRCSGLTINLHFVFECATTP